MQHDETGNGTVQDGPRCSDVGREQVESPAKDLPKFAERPTWDPPPRRRARQVWHQCEQCSMWFGTDVDKVEKGERRFCTLRCYSDNAAATGRFKKERNPHWKGGVSNDNMRYRIRQAERWPEREAARIAVKRAVRSGALVRQPCEACGADGKTHGHHDDYSKPLNVRWLCRPCHTAHHNSIRRQTPKAS